jgi:hypothetical protein
MHIQYVHFNFQSVASEKLIDKLLI